MLCWLLFLLALAGLVQGSTANAVFYFWAIIRASASRNSSSVLHLSASSLTVYKIASVAVTSSRSCSLSFAMFAPSFRSVFCLSAGLAFDSYAAKLIDGIGSPILPAGELYAPPATRGVAPFCIYIIPQIALEVKSGDLCIITTHSSKCTAKRPPQNPQKRPPGRTGNRGGFFVVFRLQARQRRPTKNQIFFAAPFFRAFLYACTKLRRKSPEQTPPHRSAELPRNEPGKPGNAGREPPRRPHLRPARSCRRKISARKPAAGTAAKPGQTNGNANSAKPESRSGTQGARRASFPIPPGRIPESRERRHARNHAGHIGPGKRNPADANPKPGGRGPSRAHTHARAYLYIFLAPLFCVCPYI